MSHPRRLQVVSCAVLRLAGATGRRLAYTLAMLSLEPEIQRLRAFLGDPLTDLLLRRERREVFSVHPEVRIAGWGGAVLIATAAGIVLKEHLDRLGPVTLAAGIAVLAALCYVWTWWRRGRAGLVDDYVLLLGSLLVSADVAFVETQIGVLGESWPRHFLILAVIHGGVAYLYGSRVVLSLSIAALAAWVGIEQSRLIDGAMEAPELALRAFLASAMVLAWREIDRLARRRVAPAGAAESFAPVFEHFASHFALIGGMALVVHDETREVGLLVTLVVASLVILWGFRTRRESFVLYAFLYAVIATDVVLVALLREEMLALLVITISMIGAVVVLFAIHARFREAER